MLMKSTLKHFLFVIILSIKYVLYCCVYLYEKNKVPWAGADAQKMQCPICVVSGQVKTVTVEPRQRKHSSLLSASAPSGDSYHIPLHPSIHTSPSQAATGKRGCIPRPAAARCSLPGYFISDREGLASLGCVYLWRGDPHRNPLL